MREQVCVLGNRLEPFPLQPRATKVHALAGDVQVSVGCFALVALNRAGVHTAREQQTLGEESADALPRSDHSAL